MVILPSSRSEIFYLITPETQLTNFQGDRVLFSRVSAADDELFIMAQTGVGGAGGGRADDLDFLVLGMRRSVAMKALLRLGYVEAEALNHGVCPEKLLQVVNPDGFLLDGRTPARCGLAAAYHMSETNAVFQEWRHFLCG